MLYVESISYLVDLFDYFIWTYVFRGELLTARKTRDVTRHKDLSLISSCVLLHGQMARFSGRMSPGKQLIFEVYGYKEMLRKKRWTVSTESELLVKILYNGIDPA